MSTERHSFRKDIERSLDVLRQRLRLCTSLNTIIDTRAGHLQALSKAQAIFSDRPSDPCEAALHQVIMSHAARAERAAPGGFDACIEATLTPRPAIAHMNVFLSGRHPSQHDIDVVLDWACRDDTTRRVLVRAVQLAGFGGKVIIERAQGSMTTVEVIDGHAFIVSSAVNGEFFDRPIIVTIDGVVETVAEIDALLRSAHDHSENVLLLARGFGPDVIATLKLNRERGTLCVIPVQVQFDELGINTLRDVAIVAQGDVVSSLKGELISSVTCVGRKRVDRVLLERGRMTVWNDAARSATLQHVEELRRRSESQEQEALRDLLRIRARSLSHRHVVVRLPDGQQFTGSQAAIDRGLRSIAACLSHGVSDDHDLAMLSRPAPTIAVVAGLVYAERCLATIKGLGAIITA
jgi:hypothetical protein